MKKYYLALAIDLISILLVLTSCSRSIDNNKDIEILNSIIKENIGNDLIVPVNIRLYSPSAETVFDSTFFELAPFKIYTHINVSCGTCIGAIALWQELESTVFRKYKVPVIIICGSEDRFELFQYLCESGTINDFYYPFVFDLDNQYVKLNKYMSEAENITTVLTDRQNKILLFGNPLLSKKLEKLYVEKINQQ